MQWTCIHCLCHAWWITCKKGDSKGGCWLKPVGIYSFCSSMMLHMMKSQIPLSLEWIGSCPDGNMTKLVYSVGVVHPRSVKGRVTKKTLEISSLRVLHRHHRAFVRLSFPSFLRTFSTRSHCECLQLLCIEWLCWKRGAAMPLYKKSGSGEWDWWWWLWLEYNQLMVRLMIGASHRPMLAYPRINTTEIVPTQLILTF